MKPERVQIGGIPALLYGAPAERGYLFLHGQMGRKEEAEAFAQVVCPKGYQVLSIDLPAHGERQGRGEALEHSLPPGQQHRGLLCHAGR